MDQEQKKELLNYLLVKRLKKISEPIKKLIYKKNARN